MTRILVADRHPLARRGIIHILSEGIPTATFDEASTALETLQKIRAEKWGLLTLDIDMPDRSGIDLLEDLKLSSPKLPILVLSTHSEEQYGSRVLKSGAAGYLSKDAIPLELTNAVCKLLRGGRYVSAGLCEILAMDLYHKSSIRSKLELLSNRELEVLRMLAAGKTVTAIGHALALNSKTISTYRQRILVKLGLESTADLIRFAIEQVP